MCSCSRLATRMLARAPPSTPSSRARRFLSLPLQEERNTFRFACSITFLLVLCFTPTLFHPTVFSSLSRLPFSPFPSHLPPHLAHLLPPLFPSSLPFLFSPPLFPSSFPLLPPLLISLLFSSPSSLPPPLDAVHQ